MYNEKIKQLQNRIAEIRAELTQLGELRPGSISKQYNVCGKPNCRCKDPDNPRKHGPYFQLSYTWRGRSTSQFVQEERLEEVQEQLRNYKIFRKLTQEWVDVSIEIEKLRRERKKKGKDGKRTRKSSR